MTNESSSVAPPKPRRKSSLPTLILIIGILATTGLFVWAEMQRRAVKDQLEATSQELAEIRRSTEQSGEEAARQVLEQLRRHIDIPTDPAPTVATIIDVDRLRETNEFYNQAQNGHHLIITDKRAILYDSERDILIDVVPVQINPASPEPSPGEPVPAETDPTSEPAPVTP
jgi:type II secretory pathway pseudopilin PulG